MQRGQSKTLTNTINTDKRVSCGCVCCDWWKQKVRSPCPAALRVPRPHGSGSISYPAQRAPLPSYIKDSYYIITDSTHLLMAEQNGPLTHFFRCKTPSVGNHSNHYRSCEVTVTFDHQSKVCRLDSYISVSHTAIY